MHPTKSQVNWSFGSEKEAENRISDSSHGGHLGFSIRGILSIFDLQVTLMLPTKNQVNWPLGSGEEARKIDFQDSSHGGHVGYPLGTTVDSRYLEIQGSL